MHPALVAHAVHNGMFPNAVLLEKKNKYSDA
jgi:hypothetical protein